MRVDRVLLVLDTSFLVDVARGRPAARALVDRFEAEGHAVLIPTLVVVELLGGSRDPRADLEILESSGEVVEFGALDAEAAVRLARDWRDEGRFPGWVDVMIAGTAVARGARVVTQKGSHFPATVTWSYD